MITESLTAGLRRGLAWFLGLRRRCLVGLFVLLCLGLAVFGIVLVLVLWTLPVFGGRASIIPQSKETRGMVYFNDVAPEVPWSIHVVKVNRSRQDYALHSFLGRGVFFGLAPVSSQLALLPAEWGRPLAAVNGDLYLNLPDCPGDPEGLQIMRGELVSGPSTNRICFWTDMDGQPHRGDVRSRFQVTWPDGSTLPFGLNEARASDAAVLYTAPVGASTRTHGGGLELVLEGQEGGPWLPLKVGQTYAALVREINRADNARLIRTRAVLSLGPDLLARIPKLEVGAVVKISTATAPDLTGSSTAIGGGPTLVEKGRAQQWPGLRMRHPRTAIGWNDRFFFFVVVDGRQLHLSAGMTFAELADYMVKLGCLEAMCLDGGGSATCWVGGHVVNSPSRGNERPAVNTLVLLQTVKSAK
jgi:hypothetical protein